MKCIHWSPTIRPNRHYQSKVQPLAQKYTLVDTYIQTLLREIKSRTVDVSVGWYTNAKSMLHAKHNQKVSLKQVKPLWCVHVHRSSVIFHGNRGRAQAVPVNY